MLLAKKGEGHAHGKWWNEFPDPQNIRNKTSIGVVSCVVVEIG